MHLRNRAIFILLCCLNTLKLRGVENCHLEKTSATIQPLNYSKISLQVVQGNSVQIRCDISLAQSDISWIEWRRDKSTSPVLVKFVNYQAYIDPVFSNRLKVDGFGNLLIDPALAEDSAVYKCKTYTLENHVPTFSHGTTVELTVESEQSTVVTQQVRLGYPGLIDCKIDNPESSKQLLGYTWTKDDIDVTIDLRFSILTWGSMFIRKTMKEDAGLYECTAKTLNDKIMPKVYRGTKVNLDVLYPPVVVMVKETVMAALGSDVQLPCTSQGNPALVTTKWLWNEESLPKTFKHTVFPNGTLYLKNAQKDYEGIYKCTPFNEAGLGKPETTSLKIEVPPVFTILPPKTLIAKLGDNLAMVCSAVDSRIIWRKIDSFLPEFRSTSRGGSLLINNVQLGDSGKYECKATSFTGSATQTVELIVISTPIPPIITNVGMLSTSAVISWKPGYNGGSRQTIEIWYRRANSDDYHWETIIQISGDGTSYTIYDLEPQEPYLFSLRGVNRAGFGFFSDVFHTETMSISLMNQEKDKPDKPMPPGDIGLNQTKDGYLLSWSYNETPGRPQVHYFIIEYRALNSSLKWKPFKDSLSWDKRRLFINYNELDSNTVYEFRMFSFGGVFSEPSSAIQTRIAGPTISPKSSSSSTGILIMVCIVSVSAVVLFASSVYCFCFKRKRNKKVPKVTKINRKYAFPQPYSSTESNLSDSENDSCDLNDVKLIPNLSTFVRERQENVCQPNRKKVERTTKYDYQSVTLGDGYVARAAANTVDKADAWHSKPTFRQQEILPEHCVRNVDSRDDMPTAFKSGCLLPEYPELRDSYDQFCTTPSEHSSREELEAKRSIRDLDIHGPNAARGMGSGYSRYCSDDILDSVHLCKRRKKTIFEEASDAHERYQRWSMPEFTKLWYETMDSDSESTVTDQTEIVKKHQELSSAEQSTQAPCSAMANISKSNDSPCRHLSPTRRDEKEYENTEEQLSGTIDNFLLKESVSCPAIASTWSPTNFHSTTYHSSGFCEDNVDSSVSSSPSSTRSRVLVNTASRNGECDYWHESHFENDLLFGTSPKDPDDSVLVATPSTCEASVCASDSGYSGMSNGTRDSPEGEEQDNYNPLGDKRIDILSEPHLFSTLKQNLHERLAAQSDSESEADNETSNVRLQHEDVQSKSIKSNPQSKTHLHAFPHIIIENTRSEAGRKDERCAQLMEEFRVNKTVNPHVTRSSLYRTYEV